jgi:hypothetical protein
MSNDLPSWVTDESGPPRESQFATCPHCGGEISPASMLGKMTSEKKKAAAIINGAKGGRPRKAAGLASAAKRKGVENGK